MPFAHIKHKVKDYTEWRRVFDSKLDFRRNAGEKSFRLFHSEGDPNDIHLLQEWESFESAKAFLGSPALKEAMKESGVIEEPKISFVEAY